MQLPKGDPMVEVMDDRRDRTSGTEARKSRETREMKVSVIKDDDKNGWEMLCSSQLKGCLNTKNGRGETLDD